MHQHTGFEFVKFLPRIIQGIIAWTTSEWQVEKKFIKDRTPMRVGLRKIELLMAPLVAGFIRILPPMKGSLTVFQYIGLVKSSIMCAFLSVSQLVLWAQIPRCLE
jgi:hypothetical protein